MSDAPPTTPLHLGQRILVECYVNEDGVAVGQPLVGVTFRYGKRAINISVPQDAIRMTDPMRLALDALWADLPYLLGRASAEGHEAGQALAQQWRAKIEAAIKEVNDGKR